jgi:riboflavin biosynthesis pyrimidine reductase
MKVRANILIDPDGRVRSGRNSSPLSSPADRARFHQLRHWADCIVVGGATFRSEPYQNSSRNEKEGAPIITFSRSSEEITDWRKAFNEISSHHGDQILVEAGPNLLHQLINAGIIDELYLTRTQRESEDLESPRFDLAWIDGWPLVSREISSEDLFEVYSRP